MGPDSVPEPHRGVELVIRSFARMAGRQIVHALSPCSQEADWCNGMIVISQWSELHQCQQALCHNGCSCTADPTCKTLISQVLLVLCNPNEAAAAVQAAMRSPISAIMCL